MSNAAKSAPSIDDYIDRYPSNVQKGLRAIRQAIAKTAPEAEEALSYGVPTFKLHGNLVHFGAWQKHIGFYPGSSGIEKFRRELSNYRSSKGAVQFPLGEPLPLELIKRIVKFRVSENSANAAKKRKPARRTKRAG